MLQVVVIGLFLASSSWAGLNCPLFAALPFPVQNCDDNAKMGQVALNCERSYRKQVKKAQAEVLAKFQDQIAKMKKQQSDSFDRTQAGYEEARKRLDDLVAEGSVARASVDDLLANIAYPEDYDEPELTGKSAQDYLASQHCFSIPEHVFQQSQQIIDKVMSDLKATREAMLGSQNAAGSASSKVQQMGGVSAVRNSKGTGSGSKIGGTSSNPASDITGTKAKDTDVLP